LQDFPDTIGGKMITFRQFPNCHATPVKQMNLPVTRFQLKSGSVYRAPSGSLLASPGNINQFAFHKLLQLLEQELRQKIFPIAVIQKLFPPYGFRYSNRIEYKNPASTNRLREIRNRHKKNTITTVLILNRMEMNQAKVTCKNWPKGDRIFENQHFRQWFPQKIQLEKTHSRV
jgi:hypothetical protein